MGATHPCLAPLMLAPTTLAPKNHWSPYVYTQLHHVYKYRTVIDIVKGNSGALAGAPTDQGGGGPEHRSPLKED